MERSQKSLLLSVFLTLLFFFSGAFVSLTPMPVVYGLLSRDERSFFKIVIPCILVVALVYGFFVPALLAAENLQIHFLFSIPFLDLAKELPGPSLFVLGVCYHSFFLVTGYAIYIAFVHYPSLFKILASLVGVTTGLTLLLVLAVLLLQSDNGFSQVLEMARSKGLGVVNEVIKELEKNPAIELRDLFWWRTHAAQVVDHIIFLSPSWLVVSTSSIVILNLILSKRFFMIRYPGLILVSLTRFRTPFVLVWLFILSFAFGVVGHKFFPGSFIYYLALNLIFVVASLFFWQGIAVLIDFLDTRQVTAVMRLLIYLTILLFLMPMFFFPVLGIADAFFDFRKLDKPPPPTQDEESGDKSVRDPDLVKMIWGGDKDDQDAGTPRS